MCSTVRLVNENTRRLAVQSLISRVWQRYQRWKARRPSEAARDELPPVVMMTATRR
jgi:hypothetical protein